MHAVIMAAGIPKVMNGKVQSGIISGFLWGYISERSSRQNGRSYAFASSKNIHGTKISAIIRISIR
jgi:hypothetical protein